MIHTVKTFQRAIAQSYIALLRQRYGQAVDPAQLTRNAKVRCAAETAVILDSLIGAGHDAIYGFLVAAIDRTDAAQEAHER